MYVVLLAISSSLVGIVLIKKAYNYYTTRYHQLVEPIDVYDFTDNLDIENPSPYPDIDGIKKSLETPMDAI